MRRCRHQNGVLKEIVRAHHEHDVENGIMDPRGINGEAHCMGYEYHCNDCGKHWSYSSVPSLKWLRTIHEQM